jgi:hypothetical protein
MNMQKDERMFQEKIKQTGIADLSDEQAGVYELSDEQLESVHGAGGGGGPTALLAGLPGGSLLSGLLGGGGK